MQYFRANGLAVPIKADRDAQVNGYPPRHIHNQNVFLQDPVKRIVTTRTGSITKLHTDLKIRKDEDSFRLPSTTVWQVDSTRRNSSFFEHFLSKFKAGIKYRCS